MEKKKEFIKVIKELSYGRNMWEVFQDFVYAASISYQNLIDFNEEREERYKKIISRYSKSEYEALAKMLGLMTLSLQEHPSDFLGEVFMELELSNHWRGQYFTPYQLSLMTAKMTLFEVEGLIERKGYVSINEPACGSGGMVIAAAQTIKELGYEPEQHLYVVAQDIDPLCVRMCHLQMSLLNIPGFVIQGDTLKQEVIEKIPTPALLTGGVLEKIEREKSEEPPKESAPPVDEEVMEAWRRGVLLPV